MTPFTLFNTLHVVWHPVHTEAVKVHMCAKNETRLKTGHWRNSGLRAATSTRSTSRTTKGGVFFKQSPHMSHIKTINHTKQQNKTGVSMSYLHTVLRLLDGVMQQTLESTLKRPALLHKRLVTADTHKVIHADITHDSDNRLSLYTGDVLYVCL